MSDFDLSRGDTFQLDAHVRRKRVDPTTGATVYDPVTNLPVYDPVDLTLAGTSIWWTLKARRDAPDAQAVARRGYGPAAAPLARIAVQPNPLTDPTNLARVDALTPSESRALALGVYHHDLQIEEPDGSEWTADRGTLTVGRDVTLGG